MFRREPKIIITTAPNAKKETKHKIVEIAEILSEKLAYTVMLLNQCLLSIN